MSTHIFISAGEASGEYYGAQLIEALRRATPEPMEFFGLGGERMRAAGCDIVVDSKQIAVVGLAEVVKHLPGIYAKFHGLLREVDRRKPEIAVLIDFPDFNFRLARELHKRGIPVVYFVSPQLWAWRKGRIKQVQRYVSKMLVIFPFEEKFYAEHGVNAEYIGHPLADIAPPAPNRQLYAAEHGLDTGKHWIALLPGSRKQEIERHLPTMVAAAKQLGSDFEFILPVASTLDAEWMKSKLGQFAARLVDDARIALSLSRAAVVASGTATVEAALAGNPFVVVYKVSPLTWALGRRMVSLENFAMVNLIAGKTIVPELIQSDFTAESVAFKIKELVADGQARSQMISELAEVRRKLRPSSSTETAADRAASAVLKLLKAPQPQLS
ncbi:MAG: lipid-A-disaccharide synthase [Candidatus Angelobacter sp.]|jgi:lipid-A-disaccharide synthase|nr:lipid-A-disaccharide synthase [Candidatus Angelobacter sp.]